MDENDGISGGCELKSEVPSSTVEDPATSEEVKNVWVLPRSKCHKQGRIAGAESIVGDPWW